ncbi:pyruvate dehydrogenase E2 component (dihydrolipoamide acetyltransferase) [Mariniphaga anaerophila]|uniref:Dihydrolipoamide acetyltransferase component of pyruvate dehydrogenase complex n=1 Tax=Mariniphaga anaerophila TaxID=1484053 RepID=A0A1M4YCR9_9BACT|nr:dihydrolipoamide acetyltransferase family protein [Mariniphaga anaerophila]SHF03408.1 pyruvate dehydrogenase E2 component (dihydrolipoamide acetyltransferase) [Mariniphaga anaerophila]
MATPVMMPRQGQSVESCIMGQWYKSVGEEVKEGDLLFSYETDKASFEEEAKEEGTLLAVFFEEGEEVPVLTNVAVIGKAGEPVDEYAPGSEAATAAQEETKTEQKEESPNVVEFDVEENESGKRVRISPLAKNMAEKMGIDIQSIKGSGPRGRIIARDVESAAKPTQKPVQKPTEKPQPETRAAAPKAQVLQTGADFEEKSIPNIRKLIATAMHQSLQNSAQLTHHLSADARQLQKLRKKYKKAYTEGTVSQNVTINDLVCFAVIRALEKFPQVNTHYLGDKMKWFKKVHLGLAVDTDRGLMVPTLQNADDLSITGLSFQLQQLATQARSGNVNPDLLSPAAASFTVSNLGNYGVEVFTPVINLPQTAILGVCTIVPRPKEIENGVYAFVPMIGLSLTYNHQALDGGEATRFLAEIKNQIENLSV